MGHASKNRGVSFVFRRVAHALKGFTTRTARFEDLPHVLAVQKRAFGRVADEYRLPHSSLPPLVESLEDLESLHAQGTCFFVAETSQGVVVGSVRASEQGSTVHVGRLVVDTGWTRMGVATALMDLLERSFPSASRFELFTGADATVPMRFYDKRGYREYQREDVGDFVLAWLEKPGPSAVS